MIGLTSGELVARARGDLAMGAPVIVAAEGSHALIFAAECISAERLSALASLGPVMAAVTSWRAETLKLRAYDNDLARFEAPANAGVTAIRAIADPSLALAHPLLGPFASVRDDAAAPWRIGIKLSKAARLLPAVVGRPLDENAAAELAVDGLVTITAEMMREVDEASARLHKVSAARVPLEVSEDARVHVFRPESGEEEHYAIEIGAPDRSEPVLSRLHSACFTGDLVGSLKCDCGPQLRAALGQIGEEQSGVLLYLNQEGRGIGLANKMRAYALQDEGFDTVEANHRLGFEDDERDFRIGAAILRALGFSSVRLMTNNPGKVEAMNAAGVAVAERVPLIVGVGRHNHAYLRTKAAKSGHLL